MDESDWLILDTLTPEQWAAITRYTVWVMEQQSWEKRFPAEHPDDAAMAPVSSGNVVYLMHDIKDGIYKIGWSCNVRRRLFTIAREKGVEPQRLRFLGSIPVPPGIDPIRVERAVHALYKPLRIGQTEWFHLTADDAADFLSLRATLSGKNVFVERADG